MNDAFVLESSATLIDFAGPWQVFHDVLLNKEQAFCEPEKDAPQNIHLPGGAGLLEDKNATTYHAFQDDFQQTYSKVHVKRGVRFVESGSVATAGGRRGSIERFVSSKNYFGSNIAQAEATWLEDKGPDWC